MNNNIFSFILIPLIILIVSLIARYIRYKFAEPDLQNGVQKPGGFDRLILYFIIFLTISSTLFTILGILLQEIEMTIVFLVLTVVFAGATLLLRREYTISYQETEKYFILESKNKGYKVYYEDISDWQAAFNEIWVLDGSKSDKEYVKVNISMLKPEILLATLLEMSAAGKFDDPTDHIQRKDELINHLIQHNYGYLVENYKEN